MANREEGQIPVKRSAPGGSFSPPCWRCRRIVPYDQLRRRIVNTSASRGVHVVLGDSVSVLDRYEIVHLCSPCAVELAAEKQKLLEAQARREAWWGRLGLGACFVMMLLFARQPIGLSVALAWTLDWLRVLGRAVFFMGLVFLAEYLIGLRPHRFRGRLLLPWAVIIGGVAFWGIWQAGLLQRAAGWLRRTHSSLATTPLDEAEFSRPSENRDLS